MSQSDDPTGPSDPTGPGGVPGTDPPDDMIEVELDDEPVTPEQVAELIDRIRMRQIRLVRWHGEAPPGAGGLVQGVNAHLEPARMRVQPEDLSLWFEHRVECLDGEGQTVATVETGVVVDFDISGKDEPALSVVSKFADTNGAFIAWPYIREAVQSMSLRLGLAPITLGLLHRDVDAYDDANAGIDATQLP